MLDIILFESNGQIMEIENKFSLMTFSEKNFTEILTLTSIFFNQKILK